MSGIELKKKDDSKKKQNIKFIICIFTSNLFLFLLMSLFSKSEGSPNENLLEQSLHENFVQIKLPLVLRTSFSDKNSQMKISLYSSKKVLLVNEAYILSEVSQANDNLGMNEAKEYLIEIPEVALKKFINSSEDKYFAYPAVKKEKPDTHTKEEVSYEFHF